MKGQAVFVDRLESILREFSAQARGIRGCVVADPKGLPIASNLPEEFDVAVIAAMAALTTQSADSVFGNMRFSRPSVVVIEGKEADVAAIDLPLGMGTLLAISAKNGNLGLLKIEMKRAALRIVDAYGRGPVARPKISELFVLHAGGELIRHYSDTLRTETDRDILGGMLTAVQSFVKDALATQEPLDEMRYGNHAVCFVRGTHTIAAFVTEGACADARYLVSDALEEFEARYASVLAAWDGRVQSLVGVDECFSKVIRG